MVKTKRYLTFALYLIIGLISIMGALSAPIHVYDCQDLQDIWNNLNAQYLLMNDIDCSGTSTWNGGLGFRPIGNSTHPFKGSLCGQGHVISGLHVNRPGISYIGLFGRINSNGTESHICNFWLKDVNITGGSYTGGLSGYVEGSSGYWTRIYEIKVTGRVTGAGSTGGITGYNTYNSRIDNTYFKGHVTGGWGSGGMTGSHWSTALIINSYTNATIGGSGGGRGGLTGQGTATVTNSFYNSDLFAASASGTGLSHSQLKNYSIYSGAGWNISLIELHNEEIWFINDSFDSPILYVLSDYEPPEPPEPPEPDNDYVIPFPVLDYDNMNHVILLFILVFLYLGVYGLGYAFRNFGFISFGFFIGIFVGFVLISFHAFLGLVFILINIGLLLSFVKGRR